MKSPPIILKDALVAATEDRVTVTALETLLRATADSGRPLALIASEIEEHALARLVMLATRGPVSCVALRVLGAADARRAVLEDVVVRTGGRVIAARLGTGLDSLEPSDLGRASWIAMDRDSTTIGRGAGSRASVRRRIAEIRLHIREAESESKRQELAQRLAGLRGGTALVRIGGRSEAEIKSRFEAFDDALNATRAAMANGVVPGGGLALLRAADVLTREAENATGDERTGMHVLKRALETPARQIAANAGADVDAVVHQMRNGTGTLGFDARSGRFVDLVEAGVIDPTKVVCAALEAAVSVAGLLLLSHSVLAPRSASAEEHDVDAFARHGQASKLPLRSNGDPERQELPTSVARSTPLDRPVNDPFVCWLDDALDELDARFNGPLDSQDLDLDQATLSEFAEDVARIRVGS